MYEAWRITYQSSEQAARAAYAECQRLHAALDVAMTMLEPIATTPRNKGAKCTAYATQAFLRTQLATPTSSFMEPSAPSRSEG